MYTDFFAFEAWNQIHHFVETKFHSRVHKIGIESNISLPTSKILPLLDIEPIILQMEKKWNYYITRMNAIMPLLSSKRTQEDIVLYNCTGPFLVKMLKSISRSNLAAAKQPKRELINITTRPLFSTSTWWFRMVSKCDLHILGGNVLALK